MLILCFGRNLLKKDGEGKTGFEKNVGMSYVKQVVNNGKATEFDASQVVPEKEVLISNLKNKEYSVNANSTVFDSKISGEQIEAVRGNEFCAITYGLSEKDAEEVFRLYEEKYSQNEYYILARNKEYVYCLSSNTAFEAAGFKELATDGRLYINHDHY